MDKDTLEGRPGTDCHAGSLGRAGQPVVSISAASQNKEMKISKQRVIVIQKDGSQAANIKTAQGHQTASHAQAQLQRIQNARGSHGAMPQHQDDHRERQPANSQNHLNNFKKYKNSFGGRTRKQVPFNPKNSHQSQSSLQKPLIKKDFANQYSATAGELRKASVKTTEQTTAAGYPGIMGPRGSVLGRSVVNSIGISGPKERVLMAKESFDESFATCNMADANKVRASKYFNSAIGLPGAQNQPGVGNASHKFQGNTFYRFNDSNKAAFQKLETNAEGGQGHIHQYIQSRRPVTRDDARPDRPGGPASLANLDRARGSVKMMRIGGYDSANQRSNSQERKQITIAPNRFRGQEHNSSTGIKVGADTISYKWQSSNQRSNGAAEFQSFRQYVTNRFIETSSSRDQRIGNGASKSSKKLSPGREIQEASQDFANKNAIPQEYSNGQMHRLGLIGQKNQQYQQTRVKISHNSQQQDAERQVAENHLNPTTEVEYLVGKGLKAQQPQKRPQTQQGHQQIRNGVAQPLSLPKTAKEIAVKNQSRERSNPKLKDQLQRSNLSSKKIPNATREQSIQAASEASQQEYDSPLMANMSSRSIKFHSAIPEEENPSKSQHLADEYMRRRLTASAKSFKDIDQRYERMKRDGDLATGLVTGNLEELFNHDLNLDQSYQRLSDNKMMYLNQASSQKQPNNDGQQRRTSSIGKSSSAKLGPIFDEAAGGANAKANQVQKKNYKSFLPLDHRKGQSQHNGVALRLKLNGKQVEILEDDPEQQKPARNKAVASKRRARQIFTQSLRSQGKGAAKALKCGAYWQSSMDIRGSQPEDRNQRLRSSEPFSGQGQAAVVQSQSLDMNAYATPGIEMTKSGVFHQKATSILDRDLILPSPYFALDIQDQQNQKPVYKMTRTTSQSIPNRTLDFLKSTLSDCNQSKKATLTNDQYQTADDYGFMQKFEMVEGVTAKYRQNALEEARKKLKKINIRSKIEQALDLRNGDQKDKEQQLLKLYNLHTTEYASKQIQLKKQNKEKLNGEARVDSMLNSRGLRKEGCRFLKDSIADLLMPLAIVIPALIVENPDVVDSMDHHVNEGCIAMDKKQYLRAYQVFQNSQLKYKLFKKYVKVNERNSGSSYIKINKNRDNSKSFLNDVKKLFKNRQSTEIVDAQDRGDSDDFEHHSCGDSQTIKTDSSMKELDQVEREESDDSSSGKPSPKRDSNVQIKTLYDSDFTKNSNQNAVEAANGAKSSLKSPEHEKSKCCKNVVKSKQSPSQRQYAEPELEGSNGLNRKPDQANGAAALTTDSREQDAPLNPDGAKAADPMPASERKQVHYPDTAEGLAMSKLDAAHSNLTMDYLEKMLEVGIINMGVCLFKYQKWNTAIKIWSQIENKTPNDDFITSKEMKKTSTGGEQPRCNFPITLLFNISLAHFLQENYDTAIDLCQELIQKICLQVNNEQSSGITDSKQLKNEINVIGAMNLKEKCCSLLDHLDKKIGVQSGERQSSSGKEMTKQGEQPSLEISQNEIDADQELANNQLREFRSMLISDMKQWVKKACNQYKFNFPADPTSPAKSQQEFEKQPKDSQKKPQPVQQQVNEEHFKSAKLFTDLQKPTGWKNSTKALSKGAAAQSYRFNQLVHSPTNPYAFSSIQHNYSSESPDLLATSLKLSLQSTDCVTLPFTNNKASSKQLQKRKLTSNKKLSTSFNKLDNEEEQQSILAEMGELRVTINQVKQGILQRNQSPDGKMKNRAADSMERLSGASPGQNFRIKNKITETRIEEVVEIKQQIYQIEQLRMMHEAKLFQAKLACADDLQRRKLLSRVEAKEMNLTIMKLKRYIQEHQQGQRVAKSKDVKSNAEEQDQDSVDRFGGEAQEQMAKHRAYVKDLLKCLDLKAKWYQRKQRIYEEADDLELNFQDGLDNQGRYPPLDGHNFYGEQAAEQFTDYEEVHQEQQEDQVPEKSSNLKLIEGETLFQRYPQSLVVQNELGDLLDYYKQNLSDIVTLNTRMRSLNTLHKKRVEEFNTYTQQRIEQAIEAKKGQQIFQKYLEAGEENQDQELANLENIDEIPFQDDQNDGNLGLRRQHIIKPGEQSGSAREQKEEMQAQQENHASFKRRLREHEALEVLEYVETWKQGRFVLNFDVINRYLIRFPYFSKYSESVRHKLLGFGTLKIYKKGEIIFRQGDPSPSIFFILRGTVAVSVKQSEMGNLPVVIKILYDGQDFGEQVNLPESEQLSPRVIERLNQQKCTTFANEKSYIFSFDRKQSADTIEKGLQNEFERIVVFLKMLDIFKDQDISIILPLANSVVSKKYTLGQYILKEGEVPQGLYMVVKGQCKVGSEKLNIRSKKKLEYEKYQQAAKPPVTLKGNFKDEYIPERLRNRERIPARPSSLKEQMSFDQYKKLMEGNQRMLFFEKMYLDEDGNKVENHMVYKDMMIFFKLLEKDVFGGRVMVTKTHAANHKGEAVQDRADKSNQGNQAQVLHEPSKLSVIADSAEVEILLIDKQNMHLFPEDVQKVLNERLSEAFSAERPYNSEVIDVIKDKFKEWDQFKIQTFLHQIRMQFNIRFQNLVRELNSVPTRV